MSYIHVLDAIVAKRIAAGEVIDRPSAALRELLDNAIDSCADNISVEIENGGIDSIRIIDNGSGMDKGDLELSILPHATSKIKDIDDLLALTSLGFRGEALASIAAVANLEIQSAVADNSAWKLTSTINGKTFIKPSPGVKGTIVQVSALFSVFPARKQFLKSASAEALACKAVFVDKAMAFPNIAMQFKANGKTQLVLPAQSLLERVLSLQASNQSQEFFAELIASGDGFKARLIASHADIYRNDKKHLQIFINKRRVQEYGLSQAIEYAYRTVLPGGALPYAYAFIEVDPQKADFNIHPAKKEVRLKNINDIRDGLMKALRDFFASRNRGVLSSHYASGQASKPNYEFAFDKQHESYRQSENWPSIAEAIKKASVSSESRAASLDALFSGPDTNLPFKYIGHTLGVFILFEYNGELIILDQHAVHERYIYDEMLAGEMPSQALLIPVVYEPDSSEESTYIEANMAALESMGFRLAKEGATWLLTAAPAILPESMTGYLFDILRQKPDPMALVKNVAAGAACKAAIKDGSVIEAAAAEALIKAALSMPEQRCPHGRPIWFRLTKDDLFKAVRRLV